MRPSIVARVKLGIMMIFCEGCDDENDDDDDALMVNMMITMTIVMTLPEHKTEVGRPGEPKHSA